MGWFNSNLQVLFGWSAVAMSMRSLRDVLVLALGFFSILFSYAYAYSSEYFTQDQAYDEVGHWDVAANMARKSCLTSATYKSSAQIQIGGDHSHEDLTFYLMVASDSWWFSEGQSHKVRIRLNGGKIWSGSGVSIVTYTQNGISIEGVEKGSLSLAGIEDTPRFEPKVDGFRREFPETDGRAEQESPQVKEGPQIASRPEESKKEAQGIFSSGTGFFVNDDGYLLTNAHVVKGCRDASVRRNNAELVPASIVARETTNDLAILKIDPGNVAYAKFRGTPQVRLGDAVVVFGFPLIDVLSKTGNLSTGLVSSLAGMGDDIARIQISAPVQSGNSGGAVVDQSGHVVGVVVSKANLQANGTGDHPEIEVVQNANFAIKAGIAQFFLDANQVHYEVEPPGRDLKVPDIAAEAREFTAQVICEVKE